MLKLTWNKLFERASARQTSIVIGFFLPCAAHHHSAIFVRIVAFKAIALTLLTPILFCDGHRVMYPSDPVRRRLSTWGSSLRIFARLPGSGVGCSGSASSLESAIELDQTRQLPWAKDYPNRLFPKTLKPDKLFDGAPAGDHHQQ